MQNLYKYILVVIVNVLGGFQCISNPSLPYIPSKIDTSISKIDSIRFLNPIVYSQKLKKKLAKASLDKAYNNQLYIINDLLSNFQKQLTDDEKINLFFKASQVYKIVGKYNYSMITIDSAIINSNKSNVSETKDNLLFNKIQLSNSIGMADTALFIIQNQLAKNKYSKASKIKLYPELITSLLIKGNIDSAASINKKMYDYTANNEFLFEKFIQSRIIACKIEILKGNTTEAEKIRTEIINKISSGQLSKFQNNNFNREAFLLQQDILSQNGKYDAVIENIKIKHTQLYQSDSSNQISDNYEFELKKRLANAFFNKGKFTDAIQLLNSGILFLSSHISPECIEISMLEDLLAQIYYEKSDYGYALSLANRSINIHSITDGNNTLNYSESITTKGLIEIALENESEAINYLQQALEIRLQLLGPNHLLTGISYNNLGLAYRLIKKYEAADTCFNKASENYTKNISNKDHPYFARIHNDIGTIEQNADNFNNAIENYILSLKIYRKLYGIIQPDVAEGFYNVATLFQKQKKYSRALLAIQECFISNVTNYSDTVYTSNPPIDQAISEFILLRAMYLKAQLLKESAYLQSDYELKNKYLENALNCYLLTGKIIDKLRRGYVSEESKLFLSEKTAIMYEEAIGITRELRESKNQIEMDNIAFNLSESSKAGILIGTITEANAKKVSGIPDSLLVYEQELQYKLSKAEKLTVLELKKGVKRDTILIAEYQKNLFNLKNESVSFIHKLEIEYPKYYELKYKQKNASIQDVQDFLLKNESRKEKNKITLLEYFIGKDSIYIFCITEDDYHLITVHKDLIFFKNTKAIRNSVSLKIDEVFLNSSAALYDQLITPISPYIKGKNLIIVPDVLISNLPFQTLISPTKINSKALTNKTLTPNVQYLINKYQLSFFYSATLGVEVIKSNDKNSYSNAMIAFAPGFSKDTTKGIILTNKAVTKNNFNYYQPQQDSYNPIVSNNDLEPIPMTIIEVNALGERMKNSKYPFVAYENQFADERVLKDSSISQYSILHFASHNYIDLTSPKESGLFFSIDRDSTEDGLLQNSELYGINLHSNLVVLSACETALGKTIPGEGIIGLSRGFIYAGTSNIMVSLWKINDASTADLINIFYKYVKKGESYKKALQNAQLKSMKSKKYYQPYYWAPLILIGN